MRNNALSWSYTALIPDDSVGNSRSGGSLYSPLYSSKIDFFNGLLSKSQVVNCWSNKHCIQSDAVTVGVFSSCGSHKLLNTTDSRGDSFISPHIWIAIHAQISPFLLNSVNERMTPAGHCIQIAGICSPHNTQTMTASY